MSIMVTGATGMFGGAVLEKLLELGEKPLGVTRSESKGERLRAKGAVPVVGDLSEPDTLKSALEGVERAFLVSLMEPGLNVLEKNFIDLCAGAGVKHVVKLYGCVEHGDDPLNSLHLDSIAHLKKSGLQWTLVSPNTVTESNFFPHAPTVSEESKIYACAGDGRCGFVALKDCAEVAAHVLTTDGHHGQDYQVTGPEAISFYDAAATLSELLNREVEYVDIPEESMLEYICSTGLTPEQAEMAVLCHYRLFKAGKAELVTDTVPKLLGRTALSFRDFATANLERFR